MNKIYEYTNSGIIISNKLPKATGNQIFDYYNIPSGYLFTSKCITFSVRIQGALLIFYTKVKLKSV